MASVGSCPTYNLSEYVNFHSREILIIFFTMMSLRSMLLIVRYLMFLISFIHKNSDSDTSPSPHLYLEENVRFFDESDITKKLIN
jgi:hypothetical protein